MKTNLLCISGLVISLGVLSVRAAQTAPTVDSVLQKHIEAIGGKTALQKHKSRVLKIKMESDAIGSSEGEILAKAPNKQRTRIDMGGTGTLNEGFDGTVAWVKSPWEGMRIKAGDELAKVKREANFHRELEYKKLYPDLAYKGTEKAGDEDAYVLEAKPSATSKERFLFSVKTGLLLRQESQLDGPQGQVNLVLMPQDYKEFDGVKYPTQIKMKFANGSQTFDFTLKVVEVKHDVELPDEKFGKDSAA